VEITFGRTQKATWQFHGKLLPFKYNGYFKWINAPKRKKGIGLLP
jgi:hypothetical protein